MNSVNPNETKNVKLSSWLAGVCWSFELRGYPKWIDKHELKKHYRIALQCLGEGAFNPLQVWEMESYTEGLMLEAKHRI